MAKLTADVMVAVLDGFSTGGHCHVAPPAAASRPCPTTPPASLRRFLPAIPTSPFATGSAPSSTSGFADLYPARGQPAYAPWRLALVTLHAVPRGAERPPGRRGGPGQDRLEVPAQPRTRATPASTTACSASSAAGSSPHEAGERLLARVLDAARALGLLKARGRQRTDSTHVLAAVRDLNRIELVAETLRATLNAIATVEPDWLRAFAPPDWLKRYGRRIEDARLPEPGPKREAYVRQVGEDGYRLLEAVAGDGAPEGLASLPAVAVLRRVWARHFERPREPEGRRARSRAAPPVQGRGPGDRVESPYDIDARFRTKGGTGWTGYMAHLTETCDEGAPRLVVHTDTTPANVHEATRTGRSTPRSPARASPRPSISSTPVTSAPKDLIGARERYGIDLVGPGRPGTSWQEPRRGRLRHRGLHRRCGIAARPAARRDTRARSGGSTRTRRAGPTSASASAPACAPLAPPRRAAPAGTNRGGS